MDELTRQIAVINAYWLREMGLAPDAHECMVIMLVLAALAENDPMVPTIPSPRKKPGTASRPTKKKKLITK